MEKVMKFLEQYVQWLVIALGAVWLGWQGYSYLYQEPLTAQIGTPPTEVIPGTIDPKIRDGSAHRLELAIADPQVTPPKPAKVLEIVRAGLGELKVHPVPILALGGACPHAPYSGGGQTAVVAEGPIVDKLPNPPAAMPPDKDHMTTRWTVINAPAATQPAAPVAGAAGAAPVQPVTVREDKAYFSAFFKVDGAKLAAEITRCYSLPNVPPNILTSEFVRVELLREEKTANGTWSPATVIAYLPIFDIMPHPAGQKPPLAADPLKAALYKYKDWFEANQDIILHPAFYQTAADAEIWVQPGTEPPAPVVQPGQVVAERPFDPSRDNPKTPDEIRQKQQYQEAVRAAKQQQSGVRRGPGAGARGPGFEGTPGAYAPPSMHPGVGPSPFNPGGIRPPGSVYPTNPGIPPAMINPNAGRQPNWNDGGGLPNQDIQILVHDVTIQEGKTYRYAVRYKLFNPVWDHPQLAKAAIAEQFDVDSPDPTDPASVKKAQAVDPTFDPEKLWTAEVNVEPRAHIFVTKVNASPIPASNMADFVVYTWANGHWKEANIKKVTPGDVVRDAKAVTPWTVVDVRKDTHTGEAYVILMDNHGVLSRRDEASDSQSPEMQKLKAESGAAATAR